MRPHRTLFFFIKNFFISLKKGYLDLFIVRFDPNLPLPENSIEELFKLIKVLNKLKINYFVTDGTILGLYRDNKFISHDNDIDIALIDNKRILKLFFTLVKSGWKPMRILIKELHVYQLIFHKRRVIIDFCNWKKDGQNIVFNAPEIKGYRSQNLKFYSPTKYKLEDGRSYISHSLMREWLKIRYGDTWHIPKSSKSDWMEETKDIIF